MASCAGDDKKTPDELNAESVKLFQKKKIDKAIEKAEKALQKATLQYGENHIALSGIIQNLAQYYFAKLQHDKAESLYKKAMDIEVAVKGRDNMDVAKIMNKNRQSDLKDGNR